MSKKENFPVNLNLSVGPLKKSATLVITEKCREMGAAGKEIFQMGIGQPPFPVPAPVVEALKQHAQKRDYLPEKGLYTLREAIANSWNRKQGLKCTA